MMDHHSFCGTSNSSDLYLPAHPYDEQRLFEPDRIIVPPPFVGYENGKARFEVEDVAPFDHRNDSCGNAVFLQSIRSCYRLQLNHTMLSWRYEFRREAQPILPYLILGPSSVAKDADFIKQNGITFLLAVRSAFAIRNRPNYMNPATFPTAVNLQTDTFDLDTPYDLIRQLRPKLKLINDHLEFSSNRTAIETISDIKGKVLVFCESGNERSTVVVAAYIMVVYGVDAISAIQVVQSQRFCINVDDSMKRMLQDLDAILIAERQVAALRQNQSQRPSSSTMSTTTLNASTKRRIDTAYESDGMLVDEQDLTPEQKRSGTAPFLDMVP